MGKRVEKSESMWRVSVTVMEARTVRDVDSYDDKVLSVRDDIVEHVDMKVAANSKNAAISKAINHLNGEMDGETL